MSTDGASVNTGKHSGLSTKLKERNKHKHVVTTHAVAHLLELGVHNAVEYIPEVASMLNVNQEATVEYNGSAKKLLQLESVAEHMTKSQGGDRAPKMRRLQSRHDIRWQESVYRGTTAIISIWQWICTDLL